MLMKAQERTSGYIKYFAKKKKTTKNKEDTNLIAIDHNERLNYHEPGPKLNLC